MTNPVEAKITDSDSGEDRNGDGKGKKFRLTPSTYCGIPISVLVAMIIAISGGVWIAASSYASVQSATTVQTTRMDRMEADIAAINKRMEQNVTKEDFRNLRDDLRVTMGIRKE